MFNLQQRAHTVLANAVSTLFSILFVVGFLTPYYNRLLPTDVPGVSVHRAQL